MPRRSVLPVSVEIAESTAPSASPAPFASLACAALAALLCSAANAQQPNVSFAARAVTPLTVSVFQYVGPPATVSQPVGPLTTPGSVVAAGLLTGSSTLAWDEAHGPDRASFSLALDGWVSSPIFAYLCDPLQVVVDVAAPAARDVAIDVSVTAAGSPLVFPLMVAVDIGADGVVEFPAVPAGATVTLPARLDTAPLPIAISTVQTWNGSQQSSAEIELRVRPDNAVDVVLEAHGCLPATPGFAEPVPIFAGRGVELTFEPGLLVAGFTASPLIWDPSSPLPFAASCVVVPLPEALLWLPGGSLTLPLPAAIRPLDLHLQVVFPTANGWAASDAWRLTAN